VLLLLSRARYKTLLVCRYTQLSQANKKLKDPKYRLVNKKALDQYVSFSEQRDALTSRKGDQDNADASIQQLIEVLDNQKDEAIERTFKQVSKYFTEVFRELVPGGEAHLIMQTRMDAPDADEGEGDADADADADDADEMDEDGLVVPTLCLWCITHVACVWVCVGGDIA
jgi:hypothetical protein